MQARKLAATRDLRGSGLFLRCVVFQGFYGSIAGY